MKKTMITSKFLAIAIAATITMSATASHTFANDKIENPVEIKYIGYANALPVYQLNFNNSTTGSYVIFVKDESGTVLYNEKVSGAKIVRNYRFDTAIPVDAIVSFEVRDLKTKDVKIYSLSRKTKVVEDFVVNEVK